MKAFIVLAIVAAASANPQILLNNHLVGGAITTPLVSQAILAPAVTKTQYHAQDELGQASYGYAHPGQAHAAVRDAAGNVRGSYAYVNPEGKEVRVEYVADGAGFRVASNALPVGPVATPVATPLVANLVAQPGPVQETPEVLAARASHLLAHQEALARSGRKKRALLTSAVIPTTLGHSSVISHPVALGNTVLTSSHLASPLIASPALTYSAIASPAVVAPQLAVRDATLTTIQNNPGHAISYRVD